MTRLQALSFAVIVGVAVVCPGPGVALAQASQTEASHQVLVEGEHLRVTSRWYGQQPGLAWVFATPLPPGTRVLGRGVAATLDPDDQTIIGVAFDEQPSYPLVLELETPRSEGDQVIPLPLPPDPGWQRIEVGGNYRLVPDLGAAVPIHTTGYYAPGDLHVPDRLRIDRRLDGRYPAGAAYIPGAMLIEAGGVPGQLESGATRKLGLGLAAGGVFFTGLFVLVVVFRRQASVVEVEQAQAYLDEEFRALGGSDAVEGELAGRG